MTEKLPSAETLAGMPLHEITITYGTAGLIGRYNLEVASLPEESQWQLNQAFLSAAEWHKDQKRTNGPYIDHILRVMLRVISHYGIDDPDILTAALLHDSIEDQRDKIVGHEGSTVEEALAVVTETYNPRVAAILKALTNPPGDISREQYDEHVRQSLLGEPDATPVKISDFADNAAGIFWTIGEDKKHQLSYKYLPLVPFYRDLIYQDTYPFNPEAKQKILKQLSDAELRMNDIIKAARQQSVGTIASKHYN